MAIHVAWNPMKITARIAIILSAILAFACYGIAYKGFSSLGGLTDPAIIRDSKGFAWFWVFMGSVILAIAVLSWWITGKDNE
jgi:hypothetical protein